MQLSYYIEFIEQNLTNAGTFCILQVTATPELVWTGLRVTRQSLLPRQLLKNLTAGNSTKILSKCEAKNLGFFE